LWTIKRPGGVAIVQQPNDARFESKPRSALERVDVDYILPATEIGTLLMKLAARNPMRTQRRAGVAQSGSEPRMPVVVSTPSTLAGADRARFSNVYRINAIASGSQNPRIEINTPKMIPRAAPSGSSTRVELSTRAYRRENPAAGRTSCVNVCAIVASPSWFDFRFQGSRGPHAGESGRTPFSL
jgi:hypothetical protein